MSHPTMRSLRSIAGITVLWTIPGLTSALETSAYARALGRHVALTTLLARVTPWYVWALATPIVVGLVRRAGVSWPPRARTVAIHIALGCLIASVHTLVYTALVRAVPLNGPPALSFGRNVATEFLGWAPVSLLAYAALLGVGAVLVLSDQAVETARRAAALEGALATAELAALRSQIQPHFVFNVLNTIGAFVREGDQRRALRTIELFGDALRTVLRSESAHLVPLADELAALRHYVEIEETRYEDRVSVRWCVDPALGGHAVPALIYQPVVENAFRHGVGRRVGPSIVEIGARTDAGQLTLWVRESGGAADAPAIANALESNGIGLSNTAARLRALYGSAGRVVLRAEDAGSLAEIQIPLA